MAQQAVVLADGSFPTHPRAAGELLGGVPIVCCDGAVDRLVGCGLEPVAVVGDGDSISPQAAARWADRLHLDPDQDTNDLTKAVHYCAVQGWNDITILGATGGREDHTLGNISLLAQYAAMGLRVKMVTDRGVFTPILKPTIFACSVGVQVSVFVLDPRAAVAYRGLKYDLPHGTAPSWWCGTLNEALADEFEVIVRAPTLVFIAF